MKIIHHFRRVVLAMALLSVAFVLPGCIAAAGVGAAYALGEETTWSDKDVPTTTKAVRDAFTDFGVTYTGTETKSDGVYVRGYKFIEDDNEDVVVGIWNKGEGEPVKIEVRIGTVGKKDASMALIAAIQKRLGQ